MNAQLEIMNAIHAAAQAESRVMTDDELKNYDAAEAEYNRLAEAKAREEKLKNMKNSIAVEPEHEPAPVAGARTVTTVERAALKPYNSVGDVLKDVYAHAHNSGLATDRLKNAKLNTEAGADGGFLLPQEFTTSMLEQAISESILYSRATELTLTGNSIAIPGVKETSRANGSRFGGISVNWIAEGSSGSYTQPSFDTREIKLSKIMGLVSVTDEMMEDAAFLSSWIGQAFPAEMSWALDESLWKGDGNGKPLGIMNGGGLVTVAKETDQVAKTIVFENITKMRAHLPARRRANAAWFVTQEAEAVLPLLNLSVGTGGVPVYLPAGGASATPFSTLLGMPVIPIEQASALGTVGDIVLADMSDYIAVAKGGIKTAQSIHVDFDKACTAFRFIKRVNGMPYTKNKLQSYSDTTFYTSPYVALATRS